MSNEAYLENIKGAFYRFYWLSYRPWNLFFFFYHSRTFHNWVLSANITFTTVYIDCTFREIYFQLQFRCINQYSYTGIAIYLCGLFFIFWSAWHMPLMICIYLTSAKCETNVHYRMGVVINPTNKNCSYSKTPTTNVRLSLQTIHRMFFTISEMPWESSRTMFMMTSSNGNIFRFTGHLCGEFTGHRWIPHTKASDAELLCFLWSAPQ